MAKNKKKSDPLKNVKYELFSHLYAGYHNAKMFGNGTNCYATAYGYADKINANLETIQELSLKKPAGYTVKVAALIAANRRMKNIASVEATRLLVNPSIIGRINVLMESLLTNDVADRELAFVVLQRDDLNSKVAAIKEYNRVKSRVSDKLEGEFVFKWEGEEKSKKK